MRIEVSQKVLHMNCPKCGHPVHGFIPIKVKEGKGECPSCGTPFEWEEQEENKAGGERIMSIRERILRKVFPEVYEQVDKAADIVAAYQVLKESLKVTDGTIKIEGPTAILGDLTNCRIKVAPKINTEVVLSKYELEAMLRVVGERHMVTNNQFDNHEQKVEA